MDRSNSRTQSQGVGVGVGNGEPAVDGGDWRSQLAPDSRERIVSRIMETLKRHLLFSGQEVPLELKKIAVQFEEKIFIAATSQSDYLRKTFLKLRAIDTKSYNPNGLNNYGSSGNMIDPELCKKRKRRAEGEAVLPKHDRLAAKEAELIVAQKALEASQEELKAVKYTLGMLSTNVELVDERHIKLREAIVEKWMQSETGKASLICFSYKGFEHASFGEDHLL